MKSNRLARIAFAAFLLAPFPTLGLFAPTVEARVTHPGGTITGNQTWLASDTVHVVTGDITVATGATLTIQAGCVVKFASDFCSVYPGLLIDGTLNAVGTAVSPIYFTSYRDDAAGSAGDTNGDGSATVPAAGDWERIRISSLSTGSVLDYCVVRYGGRNGPGGFGCAASVVEPMLDIVGASPVVDHCTFFRSAVQALSLSGGTMASVSNSSITSSGSYAIVQNLDSAPVLSGLTVTGNPGNGIQIAGPSVTGSRRWKNFGLAYIVTADLTVSSGATLTIDPGCVVKFATDYCSVYPGLLVDGTLTAVGTAGAPIYFTSYRDDAAGTVGDTNGDGSGATPATGDWERIRISSLSTGSVLDYCVVRYGGRNGPGGFGCAASVVEPLLDIAGGSPAVDHCTIFQSAAQALSFSGGTTASVSNTSITGSGSYAIVQSLDSAPVLSGLTVTGNPGNGIQIAGTSVSGSRRWKNFGLPYIVTDDLTLTGGATLTIDPGCVVKFVTDYCSAYPGLVVDGTLNAVGTAVSPIYFTSYRDDAAGSAGDTNGDGSATVPAAGDWERIRISSLSTGSVLDYCVVRYGGRNGPGGFGCAANVVEPLLDIVGGSPIVNHCTLFRSAAQALSFSGGTMASVSNSSITSSGNYAIVQSLDSAPVLSGLTATGNPGNGIQIAGTSVSGNQRWKNFGLAYIVTADLTVSSGATLTIDPGCVVKFVTDYCSVYPGLLVDGTLTAVGTAVSPIFFTSYRDDAAGTVGDTNGDGSGATPAAGDWEWIDMSALGAGSVLDYCVVRYGGRNGPGGFGCAANVVRPLLGITGTSPFVDHSTFSNAVSTLIQCDSGANPIIHRSSLLAPSTAFGVNNTSSAVTIDASLNWWGAGNGPNDPIANPTGLGSKVSANVTYRPYQVAPFTTTPHASLTPAALLAYAYGTSPVTSPLTLQNGGDGPLTFAVYEAGGEPNASLPPIPSAADLKATNVAWLDVSPTGGTLAPSGSMNLQVTLTAPSATAAEYSAYVVINTNDPNQAALVVPITFRVNPPLPPRELSVGDPGLGSSLKLTWSASSSGGVSRYRIYRAFAADGPATVSEVDAAQREFTDFSLEDNRDYYYSVSSVSASGLEGDMISAAPRTAHNAVVLVHGLCADSSDWNALKVQLRGAGFAVYGDLNLTPHDARPQDLVAELETRINAIPGTRVNIVAHSMGGLVSREFLVRQFEINGLSRVGKLITLATPHHGSDGARWLNQHQSIRQVIGLLSCEIGAPAFTDLIPGSRFLNGLNYGAGPGEAWMGNTSSPHGAESLRDPSVEYRTIAGTGEWCDGFGSITRPAWVAIDGTHMSNDGIVGIFSAHLSNTNSQGWNDVSLGSTPLAHSNNIGSCQTPITSSSIIGADVITLLRGEIPTATGLVPVDVANVTEQVSADPPLADLPSPSGTLALGQTLELPLVVPSTTLLRVYAVASPAIHLRLRVPNGGPIITPADSLTPGIRYSIDPFGGEFYEITEPDGGTWGMILDASGVPLTAKYATVAQVASSRLVKIQLSKSALSFGDSVHVSTWYEINGVPTPNAILTGSITPPVGGVVAVPVFDDGTHGDAGPSDGIFGGSYKPGSTLGEYAVQVTGTPPAGGGSTARTQGTSFVVGEVRDLAVLPSSITLNSPLVHADDHVTVFASVKNQGSVAVSGIAVEFWDGSPGTRFGTTTVDLLPGEIKQVQATWIASLPDTHEVRVTIDPFGLADEIDYSNNMSGILIVLGQPNVGVGSGVSAPKLSLSPARPNPARGLSTIEFSVPRETSARLQLFDLAGRSVRIWEWGKLAPGPHSVEWDGRTDAGDRARAGVYFYRLTVGAVSLQERLVRIR